MERINAVADLRGRRRRDVAPSPSPSRLDRRDVVVAAVPTGHPLAARETLGLAEPSEAPLIDDGADALPGLHGLAYDPRHESITARHLLELAVSQTAVATAH